MSDYGKSSIPRQPNINGSNLLDVTGISDDTKQKARAICDILLEELYLKLRQDRSEVQAAVRLGQVVHVVGLLSVGFSREVDSSLQKSALIIFESLNLAQFFDLINCDQTVNELLFS